MSTEKIALPNGKEVPLFNELNHPYQQVYLAIARASQQAGGRELGVLDSPTKVVVSRANDELVIATVHSADMSFVVNLTPYHGQPAGTIIS